MNKKIILGEIPEKDIERLEELMKMLEIDDLTIDKLTLEEQKQFSEFIRNSKNLNKYIKEWVPWWKKDKVYLLLSYLL